MIEWWKRRLHVWKYGPYNRTNLIFPFFVVPPDAHLITYEVLPKYLPSKVTSRTTLTLQEKLIDHIKHKTHIKFNVKFTLFTFPAVDNSCAANEIVDGVSCAAFLILSKWSSTSSGRLSVSFSSTCIVAAIVAIVVVLVKCSHNWGTLVSRTWNDFVENEKWNISNQTVNTHIGMVLYH